MRTRPPRWSPGPLKLGCGPGYWPRHTQRETDRGRGVARLNRPINSRWPFKYLSIPRFDPFNPVSCKVTKTEGQRLQSKWRKSSVLPETARLHALAISGNSDHRLEFWWCRKCWYLIFLSKIKAIPNNTIANKRNTVICKAADFSVSLLQRQRENSDKPW